MENLLFPCSLKVIVMSILAAEGAAVATEQRPRIRVDGNRQAYRQVIHHDCRHRKVYSWRQVNWRRNWSMARRVVESVCSRRSNFRQ